MSACRAVYLLHVQAAVCCTAATQASLPLPSDSPQSCFSGMRHAHGRVKATTAVMLANIISQQCNIELSELPRYLTSRLIPTVDHCTPLNPKPYMGPKSWALIPSSSLWRIRVPFLTHIKRRQQCLARQQQQSHTQSHCLGHATLYGSRSYPTPIPPDPITHNP